MLDKLEKKLGRFAVKHLIYYILGAYVLGYIFYFLTAYGNSQIYAYLTLNPAMVMQGQIWRLVTWVMTIPQAFSIWIIFMFMLYFFIGRVLEDTLGAFRYNVFIFSGWLFTTLGAMIAYWITSAVCTAQVTVAVSAAISANVSTYYINLASFLAFAVLFPNTEVYLFMILPIKMKWLAWFDVAYLVYEVVIHSLYIFNSSYYVSYYGGAYSEEYFIAYGAVGIVVIVVSVLNFIIFFLTNKKLRRLSPSEMRRRQAYRSSVRSGERQRAAFSGRTQHDKKSYRPDIIEGQVIHRCAVCGRTNIDYPDLQFRYCSKCNGNYEYCQDHIFTHEHVK